MYRTETKACVIGACEICVDMMVKGLTMAISDTISSEQNPKGVLEFMPALSRSSSELFFFFGRSADTSCY